MENEAHIHRKRNWVGGIVTLAILVFIGFFVSRVVYFSNAIRSGEIVPGVYQFENDFSTYTALASAELPNGEFETATIDDPSLGSPTAGVEIVMFGDFGCPYSRESSLVIRELVYKYPDDVFFVYRDFPIIELYPIAQLASEASECARDQDKFWEYHDKLYQNQMGLDRRDLLLFVEELNMDREIFEACLASGKYTDEVIEDYADGFEAGVRGTPTFFINGNRIPGAIPAEVFEAIIESVIRTGEI
jgi:hypothetical protein